MFDRAEPLENNDKNEGKRVACAVSRLLSASRRLRAQVDSDRESMVDSSGMKGGGFV